MQTHLASTQEAQDKEANPGRVLVNLISSRLTPLEGDHLETN